MLPDPVGSERRRNGVASRGLEQLVLWSGEQKGHVMLGIPN